MKERMVEAMREMKEQAKKIMEEDKFHIPTLFVWNGEDVDIAAFGSSGSESLRKALYLTGRLYSRGKGTPDFAVMICEGWVSTDERCLTGEMKPSQDPERGEALVVAGMDRERNIHIIAMPFLRLPGEIMWLEEVETEEAESGLLESFWLGVDEGKEGR